MKTTQTFGIALMAILAISVIPAHAQTNTELIRDIAQDTDDIISSIDSLFKEIRVVLNDVRDALVEVEGFSNILENVQSDIGIIRDSVTRDIPILVQNTETSKNISTELLDHTRSNTESLQKIEEAILGDACGIGTAVINGKCVATIQTCDADIINGNCVANVHCGHGTIRHGDTCIADFSVSFCGEGTTLQSGRCVATVQTPPPVTPVPPVTPPVIPPVTPPVTPPPVTPIQPNTATVVSYPSGIAITLSDGKTYRLDLVREEAANNVQHQGFLAWWCPVTTTPVISVVPNTDRAEIICTGLNGLQYNLNEKILEISPAQFDNTQCSTSPHKDKSWSKCTTTPTQPIVLIKDDEKTTLEISNYDYKKYGEKRTSSGLTYYGLDVTFKCTAPVTLETAKITKAHESREYLVRDADDRNGDGTAETTDTTTRTTNGLNYIEVDGFTLYHNDFQVNSNTYVELIKPRDFSDRLLSTELKFNTRIHEGEFVNATTDKGMFIKGDRFGNIEASNKNELISDAVMDNSTHDLEIDLYTLDVVWDTTQGATCSLNIDGDTPTTPSQNIQTNVFSLDAVKSDNIIYNIKPYDVTCSESVMITDVQIIQPTLTLFQNHDIIHISDDETGSDKDTTIDITVNEASLTGLSFVSRDFVIGAVGTNTDRVAFNTNTQTVPNNVGLLAEVKYKASSDSVCTWTERP